MNLNLSLLPAPRMPAVEADAGRRCRVLAVAGVMTVAGILPAVAGAVAVVAFAVAEYLEEAEDE